MKNAFKDLIVFEMANNHQGSLLHGIRIIEETARIARRYSIRAAVKLQYRNLDTFIHPEFSDRKDIKHIPRFVETRLTAEEMHTLVMAAHDNGMLSIVTPFDEESVDIALNHGVDILKVASCSCMDWPLLEAVSKSKKPIICSTGGCRISDIDRIITFFEHRGVNELALMHCIASYPAENKDQQLFFMRRMTERYPNCSIGYSGHEAPENLLIASAAIAMGAELMERHVGIPTETIKLNAYSMNPEQTEHWVQRIIETRELCGTYGQDRLISEAENTSLNSLKRGVYAKKEIKKGETLSGEKVFFAMPCQDGQTAVDKYLESMIATREYKCNEPVMEMRQYSLVNAMRSVVHEAKGFLREARISIGNDYTIELSHHYGMENFRRYGAVIVNMVNREYCKKLIILLPGQCHPLHSHIKKEETFQILYGNMELVLNEEKLVLNEGDMQLVKRGDYHSFSTQNGVIFEEISTTHIKNDSIYADDKIQRLDPVQRKTVIDNW